MWRPTSSTSPGTSSREPAGSGRGPFLNRPRLRAILALTLCASSPSWAWGDQGHRAVATLALRTLPEAPRRWYAGREADLADHASDPDHWRQDRKEGPRHYLNMEPYGDPGTLPRTLEAARSRVGDDYYRLGVVPWIIQDRWKDLVEAFRARDAAKVVLATAILSHYLADAHVPLHTTENHDGQLTGQRGVHSRWESGLVSRYLQTDTLAVTAAQADPAILERPWEWLLAAHALVPKLLEDDRLADRTTPPGLRGRTRTEAYWMIFWSRQGDTVRRQLQQSAQHLGDAILTAWIAAGKPLPPGE